MNASTKHTVIIELPWPPTVNSYWRISGNRMVISERGRWYREEVGWRWKFHGRDGFGSERIAVWVQAYPPDARERDLDNLPKALFDALQYAGAYRKDSQIDHFAVTRREVAPPEGRVEVTICTDW